MFGKNIFLKFKLGVKVSKGKKIPILKRIFKLATKFLNDQKYSILLKKIDFFKTSFNLSVKLSRDEKILDFR